MDEHTVSSFSVENKDVGRAFLQSANEPLPDYTSSYPMFFLNHFIFKGNLKKHIP
jgi:hypothetical protein